MNLKLSWRIRRFLVDRPVVSLVTIVGGAIAAFGGIGALFQVLGLVLGGVAIGLVIVVTLVLREIALREELGDVTDDVGSYRHALDTLAERHKVPFTEEVTLTYHVGRDNKGDELKRTCRTAVSGGETLAWRTFTEDASAAPKSSSADHPLSTAASVDAVVLSESATHLKALALFRQVVTSSTPADWWVSYPWPGMWMELRKSGSDFAEFLPPAGCVLTAATFIFPTDTRKPAFELVSAGSAGQATECEVGGKPALCWKSDPGAPPQSRYYFKISWG